MEQQVIITLKELENFLKYLQDKIDEPYKKETENAIENFIKELKSKWIKMIYDKKRPTSSSSRLKLKEYCFWLI